MDPPKAALAYWNATAAHTGTDFKAIEQIFKAVHDQNLYGEFNEAVRKEFARNGKPVHNALDAIYTSARATNSSPGSKAPR